MTKIASGDIYDEIVILIIATEKASRGANCARATIYVDNCGY